ncbi:MAG: NAD-dependent epimerase/dehydratase family protein [Aggregatilineales bacterium]
MILVTGATGFIGRHLVRELLAHGHPVRCLLPEHQSRRRNPLPWAESENQPEIIYASLLDDEGMFRAVTGVHTIYHLESAQWWGRPRELERVEIVGTRNLLDVARSTRVGRIITMSHLGAAPSSAFTLLRVKGLQEELIRNSGIAYTIIRSGLVYGQEDAFINHIAMMLSVNPVFFLMPGRGEVIMHPIYMDDLITALYRSLEVIDSVDKTIEIGGLEYTTLEDLIQTVMRVTGMYRMVIPVPPYLLRAIIGVYARLFRRSLFTQQWMDLLASSRTAHVGNMYEMYGVHPRRFEDTLLTYLPQKRFFFSAFAYTFRRRPRGI